MTKLPEKQFSFMDWISGNFIDFTPDKFWVTVRMSWGFIGILFVLFICFLVLRMKRSRHSS